MLLLLSFILIVWKDKIFKEKISSSTRAILWIRVLKPLLLCIRDHSSCLKSLTNIKEMHYYSFFSVSAKGNGEINSEKKADAFTLNLIREENLFLLYWEILSCFRFSLL